LYSDCYYGKRSEEKNVPDIVLKLLEYLHTHTGAKVHPGGSYSGDFAHHLGLNLGRDAY